MSNNFTKIPIKLVHKDLILLVDFEKMKFRFDYWSKEIQIADLIFKNNIFYCYSSFEQLIELKNAFFYCEELNSIVLIEYKKWINKQFLGEK